VDSLPDVKVGLMPKDGPDPGGFSLLTIGELAGRTGRRPSSIRYYEQIGLLPAPVRVHGQRRYDPATVRTLAVIDTAQRAGLTLDEIKTLLCASPDDKSAVDRLRDVADRKLPEITALIERTELVRSWLESAVRCECPDLDQCPLFDDPPLKAVPPQPPVQGRSHREIAAHQGGAGQPHYPRARAGRRA
jgi:MerR family transcriptional regulator, redox-sensitive transcriptional activator SoxR